MVTHIPILAILVIWQLPLVGLSSDLLKCSLFLQKNRSYSISTECKFFELVQTHRSLNEVQARADDAFTNFEAASKELQSSREQKKSLTLSGISGRRASRTVNAGLAYSKYRSLNRAIWFPSSVIS